MIARNYVNVVIVILLIALYSCNSPFSGYTEKEDGIYMQLLSFEESDDSFQANRYVSADIKILNENLLIYRHYKEEILSPNHQLNFLFHYLTEGDSAVFKVDNQFLKNQFPELSLQNDGNFSTIYVKVYQYVKNTRKNDKEMQEQIILRKYLKENKITHNRHGVYVKRIKSGNGVEVDQGKEITIHYIGRFLNQIEFDNTYKESSFTFIYGTPGQVIKGLEIALNGMVEGEKSKIIIPSQLAFGDEGSSTQVIPPFTSVIYELEIVKIN